MPEPLIQAYVWYFFIILPVVIFMYQGEFGPRAKQFAYRLVKPIVIGTPLFLIVTYLLFAL